MLGTLLDVFRLRQYFNVVTRLRELAAGVREDTGFVTDVARAVIPVPGRSDRPSASRVFDDAPPANLPGLRGRRVALVSTGGSGALASIVGVARALEDGGVRPAVISVCSGSALFGFPLAAGLPAEEVGRFIAGLRPSQYVDLDWGALARLAPTAGRGFAGLLRGERIEAAYRELLGGRCLGDLAVPAYAPVWNVEENRLEYLGPRTHPDVPVARAVRMAVALPLFIEPVLLGHGHWCDGGIVDIFPVHPLLEIEDPCDVAVAVNGFYPPAFAGEDATGWEDRRGSIFLVASQVRTCQQVELARQNLARLRRHMPVVMLEPVPYSTVRGVGFYRQFLSAREWPAFMRAGRACAARALTAAFGPERDGGGPSADRQDRQEVLT
ncbi:MAG TPA: patatin-like phospholipase family protein [Acidimicrobiales bacterium]|nr:patatin-like phospholipase family protein [Acidimicrobiales bacterium]